MKDLVRLSVPILLPLVAGCAESERNPFDPAQDGEPPRLVNLEIVTQDQKVFALWSASEPVRAVVEYNDPAGGTNHHAYPSGREYAQAGITKLLGLEPNRSYVVSGLRMTDRAGNTTTEGADAVPSFTTGVLAPDEVLYFAMIDVGWGDAHYLEAPDGTRTLIDAGHPEDGLKVRTFLERRGVTSLDFASMTHVHEDHVGGFYGSDFPTVHEGLCANSDNKLPIDVFLDIRDKTPGTINGPYGDLEAALGDSMGTLLGEHVFLGPGESSLTNPALQWGTGLRVDLLSSGRKDFLLPDYALSEELGSVQNNDSMVYRVQFGDFVILLTGDGEFATEQYLENAYAREFLRSHVLKLGHHGSNDANSERFIRTVDPVMALIPNAISENPGVEHPFVLQRLRNFGIDYFASDRVIPNRDRALPGVRGDVQIYTDGQAWTVVVDNITYE